MQNKIEIELQNKALLTVKEMCQYMSIGEHTARNLLRNQHKFFTVRIGNKLYANRKKLDKWIDSQTGI